MIRFIKRLAWNIKQIFVRRQIVTPKVVREGLAPDFGRKKTPFTVAQSQLGIQEFKGVKNNPRIIAYHRTCTLKATADETAWCSAFVNWCHFQLDLPRTESAMAISWLDWGEDVDEPLLGDVVVFKRRGSSWRGHVGFFVKQTKKAVLVLGGNQSNEVNYQWYPKKGVSIYLAGYRRANG